MTWLGKILTVLVLVLSLVWTWFTAQVFVTRTNWKAEAERYKKGYTEVVAARQAEYSLNAAERAALNAKVKAAEDRAQKAEELAGNAGREYVKLKGDLDTLNANYTKADTQATLIQGNLAAAVGELKLVRDLNKQKEDQIVKLVIEKETAESKEKETAIAKATFERRVAQLDATVESLRAQLDDARVNGGKPGGDLLAQRPAPLDPNTRGLITRVEGGLVTISIGEDAGITKNAELDVYRLDKGGAYIGTVRVLDTAPKHAVAQFVPPPGRTRPRPDEYPKVGDQVGKLGLGTISAAVPPR